jgi:hypothetical protein
MLNILLPGETMALRISSREDSDLVLAPSNASAVVSFQLRFFIAVASDFTAPNR